MGSSTAERNRRKRERKKKDRENARKELEAREAARKIGKKEVLNEVEVEYICDSVLEGAPSAFESVKILMKQASTVLVSDDDVGVVLKEDGPVSLTGDLSQHGKVSKRKLRDTLRPSVAELKRRVERPDLVEAHDVTAVDPEFLIELKGSAGTVPVPRHWGRKRKYLQGKRGFEKAPFRLPDFIVKTGITDIRDTSLTAEAQMNAKQKNRSRVAPKMGAIDVDYRTLHDAFFKHQTKPPLLSRFGDIYYEAKELEVNTKFRPGGHLSQELHDALGMEDETSPPPWLLNMQRYGPPPSYPALKIPGLSAPLPTASCTYGYHPGGWGKPPVDQYNRPLYGNPFDPPGSSVDLSSSGVVFVTSEGKTVTRNRWGALPQGTVEDEVDDDSEMEESSSDESEELDSEEPSTLSSSRIKDEKPVFDHGRSTDAKEAALASGPRQLYKIVDQANTQTTTNDIFASDKLYAVPVANDDSTEETEKKLSKESKDSLRPGNEDLGNFKF